ncbi:ABC transporter substrate-binding protein [Amycolatopsis sp. GM8]|uniref:ABC transporter substrate-binding protein n=1 Tax=Amycolatopsis sp. GM8 TaxID=2896530 RepID=UPI001F24B01C|nr:ABC transporter substrate-binding protein [Amycolatopsis sp. GM8]
MLAKHLRAITGLALVSVLLVACGSGASESGSGDADAGPPRQGGSLTVLQSTEPRTLDPRTMQNNGAVNAMVGNSLFGQLLIDKTGGGYEYGLAESLSTTDGGTNWTLKLRDGLVFSDGTPVDAADVKANWERINAPQVAPRNRAAAAHLKNLAPAGQTLTFTLSEPIPQYPNSIVESSMNWIAKPEALQAGPAAFDAAPIGAGPFVLESWRRNGPMVLAKNNSYYDKPRPYLDKLTLLPNGDENQVLSAVLTKTADAGIAFSASIMKQAQDEGLQTTTQDFSGGRLYNLNTRLAPFNDVRAREAVLRAVDREFINASTVDGKGTVPQTLFHKGSPFYSDAPLPQHDPARAQQLFDQLAAEGKPVSFSITSYTTSVSVKTAEAVQAQLRKFKNVTVQVEVLDFPAATAKSAQQTFQMMAGGVLFSEPEPQLYEALHSGEANNTIGLGDPQLDAALEAGRRGATPEQRKQAYADVAKRYNELYPWLIYLAPDYSILAGQHVHGVKLYAQANLRTDQLWTSK